MQDELHRRGRRSRVVLASRRWGQVRRSCFFRAALRATGARKPGSRGDHV